MTFDPFHDHDRRGYLRNRFASTDRSLLARLEAFSFAAALPDILVALSEADRIDYGQVLFVHRRIFGSIYPWAGTDRSVTAPDLHITKAGVSFFAFPDECRRAMEYGLGLASDADRIRKCPGEIMSVFAFAHPFLDGNGRTIMTIHREMARRAGFHVDWSSIGKAEYLATLSKDLLDPGKGHLDRLLRPAMVDGEPKR